jgi:hypothetical protein
MLRVDPHWYGADAAGWQRLATWLSALCALALLVLAPSPAGAQQVIMAPQIEIEFEQLEVSGDAEAVEADFRLAEQDWRWASDLGLSLWLGLYSTGQDGSWRLERVEPMQSREGSLEFSGSRPDEDESFGVCAVAVSQGGRLAPGMGYRCGDMLPLERTEEGLELRAQDATVSMSFEPQLDERSWFRSEIGFSGPLVDSGEDDDAEAEEFFVHRAPHRPAAQPDRPRAKPHEQRGSERYGPEHSTNRHRTHPFARRRDHRVPPFARRNGDRVAPFSRDTDRRIPPHARYDSRFYGFGSGIGGFPRRVTPRRFRVDRFRQRRLDRRRIFGPLDVFDSKFDQDMFSDHPDDVFYRFRTPPGHFGRDAFGRPLDDGFGPDE